MLAWLGYFRVEEGMPGFPFIASYAKPNHIIALTKMIDGCFSHLAGMSGNTNEKRGAALHLEL